MSSWVLLGWNLSQHSYANANEAPDRGESSALLWPRRHDGEVHPHRLDAAARNERLARQGQRRLHRKAGIVGAQLRERRRIDLPVLPHDHGAAAPQLVAINPRADAGIGM